MAPIITNLSDLRATLARWQSEHDGVVDSATTINLKHLLWLAPIGVVLTALHVLILGWSLLSGTYQGVTLTWARALFTAHSSMCLAMILLTVAARRLDPTRPTRWGHRLPVAAVAVCLLFAVMIVTIDQWVTPNITPFFIGCLLTSLLFYVRPLQSGALYLSATVACLFAMGLTQSTPEQLFSNRLNGFTVGLLAWGLQFVMWRNYTTITRQQHQLEQLNANLTGKQAELERLARNDMLTGLPNRLAATERLRTEFVSMKRSQSVYAVLMMDIDFFKRVNDTHGHAVGDQVLQRVAKSLRALLRESDFAARFGGEEFLALLPTTDMPAALQVAEKLRQAVASSPDPIAGPITLSIGLSMATPDQVDEDTAVGEADDALYRAKREGRNRVQLASEAVEQVEASDAVPAKLLQLVWRSKYESGNQTIDLQHRGLFRRVNKVLLAALNGLPAQELIALVDVFNAEVVQHFQDEEAIVTQAGYPQALEHAVSHQALINKATSLTKRVRAGEVSVDDLFQFLAHDVVARHMLTADCEFFPYLQRSERTPTSV